MKYTSVFIFIFSFLGVKAQDSLDVSTITVEIIQNDSSSLLPVLQNDVNKLLSPALYVQNKGGLQLALKPQFEFNNWHTNQLPFNRNLLKYRSDSTITEANYSYGLNDSHLFKASYSDKIGSNYVTADYIRNTSTGLLTNSDVKAVNFQFDVAKNVGVWQYDFGYINLSSTIQENGGVDSLFLVDAEDVTTFSIPAHLNSANNALKSQQAYFKNIYYFLSNEVTPNDSLDSIANTRKYSHGITFDLNADRSQFKYTMNQSDIDSSFYQQVLFDSTGTNDSVGYQAVTYSLGYVLLDTLDRERLKLQFHEATYDWKALNESILSFKVHSYWKGHSVVAASYYLAGYRKSFHNIGIAHWFKIRNAIVANVKIENEKGQPIYSLLSYQGNHYQWSNVFKDQEATTANIKLFHNRFKFGANIEFSQFKNFVYLNNNSVPEQALNSFMYSNFSLYHLYQRKFLRLYTKGTYQNSSSNLIRFPKLSLSTTLVYAFRLGKLRTSLGTQASYFSSFKGMAYNPNLRQMYLQDKDRVGGFPLVDVFAAVKVGGADVFVKWENILFGMPSREFFLYPSYITVPRMIRVGINWKFLN